MIFSRKTFLAAATTLTLALGACSKDGDGVLLFSVEDDIALGAQVAHETDSIYAAKGQLLQRSTNGTAYAALDRIVKRVLDNGQLQHRTDFVWDVKIIKDDSTLNAFASPGGHIYVYSGLVKYLDHEDQLAGVLGHEIAHADRRHTSRQLQQQYGISLLLSILVGDNPGQLTQIAAGLGQLKFSRDFEREADKYSVIYLNGTSYACDGAADFFIKTQASGQTSGTPEFLSTHPDPGGRVAAIQGEAATLGCANRTTADTDFDTLKRAL
ncbi:M48 family metalloprotease [Hymenobacter sp. ASUV-10]|uniref:M48 family metalloprotease n=1 Tax=Hymenobacter aranciens TaxID=3063996 RepID=A0ABT9B5R5_9BACT|nr:M48 family metalloprotease [Hymenobacter sp. ASUV-10]MDO7873614.1 M48 family metalloprotease [Hymenobacter sp. ASUV-10]